MTIFSVPFGTFFSNCGIEIWLEFPAPILLLEFDCDSSLEISCVYAIANCLGFHCAQRPSPTSLISSTFSNVFDFDYVM